MIEYIVVEGEYQIVWFTCNQLGKFEEEVIIDTLRQLQSCGFFKLYYWPEHNETIRRIAKDGIEEFLSEADNE